MIRRDRSPEPLPLHLIWSRNPCPIRLAPDRILAIEVWGRRKLMSELVVGTVRVAGQAIRRCHASAAWW